MSSFLGRFMRDPRYVGAVAPSSSYLAAKMVAPVEFRPGVKVVEFGPGTGPFTRAVLEQLPEDGRYLGIERDPQFVGILRERFPGVDVHEGSVEVVLDLCRERDMLPLDHVISGLPFASLPQDLTERVLNATAEALRPGGTFTTFGYVHAYPLPAARAFRQRMQRLFGPLDSRRLELRNLPPAFAFTWRKREG